MTKEKVEEKVDREARFAQIDETETNKEDAKQGIKQSQK